MTRAVPLSEAHRAIAPLLYVTVQCPDFRLCFGRELRDKAEHPQLIDDSGSNVDDDSDGTSASESGSEEGEGGDTGNEGGDSGDEGEDNADESDSDM